MDQKKILSFPLRLGVIDWAHFPVFQFGNTCYSNSVLQALYFCKPFRDKVLEYKARNKGKSGGQAKETLLTCLADLFHSIATQKKKVGTLAPKKFITRYVIVDSWNILEYLIVQSYKSKVLRKY